MINTRNTNTTTTTVNVQGEVQIDGTNTALQIIRNGWSGAAKIGIGSSFGHTRGLRFIVDVNTSFSNEKDALYLEETGNVSIGISDPDGASLRLHKATSPKFRITDSSNKFISSYQTNLKSHGLKILLFNYMSVFLSSE